MIKQHIMFDINANVGDVTSNVEIIENKAVAFISFKSLCKDTITAVKFNAKGYNSFGDAVYIDRKETFLLIIQDISIDSNNNVEKYKVILPSSDIRKLELEESQICLANGSVCTYSGKCIIECDIDIFDNENAEDKEKLSAIKDYEPSSNNMPLQLEDGWICLCGRYNSNEESICKQCHKEKEQTFSIVSYESIEVLVENHKKKKSEEEATAKKAQKKRNIKIAIGTIVGIAFLILIIYGSIMSSRTTYKSASEMKTALQGTWTYYNDNGDAMRQIVISGDSCTIVWKYSGSSDIKSDITWNPSQGTFKTFQTYVVKSDGTIKQDNDVYKKGGYMSSSNSDYSANSYESGSSVLKITIDSVTSNSGYTICTGSVKNNGKNTYKYVEVKGAFKDSSGNVVDTDWTYAAGSEGLAPGESSTFRLSVTKNSKISSCTVSLLDYQ